VAICSNCGRENPVGAKFCNECAAPLPASAPSPTLEERKIVSVLFCDLVGFTAASEQQDPEDVRARIRPYHARLRQEIERHGGTVEKFVGDAVMAAFGAPVAHEDDAERAVRAGLRILEAIAELNEDDPELDLQVRVGVNTGEAVVAIDARPEEGEGMVTGDVVNTAARIQSAAPVDAVAVGEQTHRATSRLFDYEPLEPVSVKGKSEPIALWRAKAARSRFGSDAGDRFRTPFVGRQLEKPLLIGIFERAAQQRSVQLVTVVGEPGVGKTRLIAELGEYVDAKPGLTRWRQGRCLPYGEGITFWALGEILKAEAGILESDSADAALAKLDGALSPDHPDRRWLLQRLAPLVGVEPATQAERQELFTAWRRFLEGLAAGSETVLVFEDLHWADEALLDFLEHLIEWSQGVPLLIICGVRPELYERRPGWGAGLRNAHTINLSPLSDRETAELVTHLIKTTVLTPELERAVLERAGGNPLYAEEFVRLLADRGSDAREAALPESVQALIAARLDTLPPDRKSLLQDAAVLGKVFWAGAVAEIGGRELAAVELALHELALKELVRPVRTSSMEGEIEYSFWHLLVRDVAYGQIPRVERVRRHRAAAAWIERKAGERVEDLAEVLAHHYVQALELAEALGDAEQAEGLRLPTRRFLTLAGERALGLDTVQAEARLARALELVASDDPERTRLLVRWSDAAAQAGRVRDAADALDEALALLAGQRDVETTAQALSIRSRVSQRMADGQTIALAAQAVELLEQEPPGPALVAAYSQLASAQWLSLSGSFAEAVASVDRAVAIADQLGLPEPARAVGYRAMASAYLGDPRGVPELERVLELLLESGAGRDAATVQNNLGIARYPLEGIRASLDVFESGIRFCRQRGLAEAERVLATSRLGLLAEVGRPDDALAEAAEIAAAFEATGQVTDLAEVRAFDLAIRAARGEQPTAAAVDWVVVTARKGGHVDITPVALSCAAVVLASTAPDRARAHLRELEQVEGARGISYYMRQLPAVVRAALATNDRPLAERLVERVEPHYPLDEHALCAARAQLCEHAGDLVEAAALYADAAERWHAFGNVPERAHALLGAGRCLLMLGRPGAERPLREARDLFASMGYEPMLEETEALLERTAAASAP
jgi:class 3 adenylate cyclase/tetratricopeptide (TPR) repeat protein